MNCDLSSIQALDKSIVYTNFHRWKHLVSSGIISPYHSYQYLVIFLYSNQLGWLTEFDWLLKVERPIKLQFMNPDVYILAKAGKVFDRRIGLRNN